MLRIAAIIVVRNGAPTISRVLSHLAENQIDVIAIDHGSVDDTPTILEHSSPTPVVDVTRVPFDGVHRWRENLGRKAEVATRAPHDWIIHTDADEIMESSRDGETLRGMIERLDREGFEMVECDEFVFVPIQETEDHSRGDFVATMRRYYHFAPRGRRMQRAIRRTADPAIDWAQSGGHRASAEELQTPEEKIRLRHYMGLPLDHLRQQYLGRVFGADELRRGWHGNRIATTPDFVTAPPAERLFDLDSDGWRTERPETSHLMFNQRKPFRLPGPFPSDSSHPPMPFVVGVGRSGTTLLRMMLDAHPNLAITPETHWLNRAIEVSTNDPTNTKTLRTALTSHDFWVEMGLDEPDLDQILEQHDPTSPSDTIRSIYRAYADRHYAERIGDKTPAHGMIMTEIAGALPESRFIHLIRDGRDVAVSHRGLWFGPDDDPRAAAIFWLWRIREMRQQAQFLPHYLEVHYEDLVRQPEGTLRRIGEFIDVPFHPAQLRAHRRARRRLSELAPRQTKSGSVSAAQRRSIHRLTKKPPDTSRIGRWKKSMSTTEIEAFERVAGNMLVDLGYPLAGDR